MAKKKPIEREKASPYSIARKEAIKRDGHKCLYCGTTEDLTLHHIFPKWKYPELYADVNNLATLCTSCHESYHREFCNNNANIFNRQTFDLWMETKELTMDETIGLLNEFLFGGEE